MSQSVSSPSLTPKDLKITHEQPESPESQATAPSDHFIEAEVTHKESSSVTAASDHSDDTDDTASTHEQPSSPVTTPSDHSDDATTSADFADPKASTLKAETKVRRPLSKVQELAAWYDLKANGNLRLQVLTWDGRVVDTPKHESKKSKKTPQAEEGLM